MLQKEQFFTVEIFDYASARYDEAVEFLVENFKIDTRRASALLHKLPKVVTKPISETQARKVVQRLATVEIKAKLVARQMPATQIKQVQEDERNLAKPRAEVADALQGQKAGFSSAPQASTMEMTTRATSLPQGISQAAALLTTSSPQPSLPPTRGDEDMALRTHFPEMKPSAVEREQVESVSVDDELRSSLVTDVAEADMSAGAPSLPEADFDDVPDTTPRAPIAFSGPPTASEVSAASAAFSGPPATGEVAAEAVGEGVQAKFGSSQRRRRSSILSKLLLAIIVPSLISILGVILGIFSLVSPALRKQAYASARQPAEATVRNLAAPLLESTNTIEPEGLANLRDSDRLTAVQKAISATRDFASGQNILFVAAVDNQGEFISGWFDDPNQIAGGDLRRLFSEMVPQMASLGDAELRANFTDNNGQGVDVLGRNLKGPQANLGALFVGIDDSSRKQQVNSILWRTLTFLLLPLVLGITLGIWQGRTVTRNIRMLAGAADDLSRGNLNADIQVRSNDEIGELADAFERLRTSLQVAFDRMRRSKRN